MHLAWEMPGCGLGPRPSGGPGRAAPLRFEPCASGLARGVGSKEPIPGAVGSCWELGLPRTDQRGSVRTPRPQSDRAPGIHLRALVITAPGSRCSCAALSPRCPECRGGGTHWRPISHLLAGSGCTEGHERRHGLEPADLPPGRGAWRAWGGCASCVDLDPGWRGWAERRGPAAEPGFLVVVRGGGTGGWARPGCAGGQSGRTPAPSAEGKNWGHLQEKARVWCVGVGGVYTCVQRALCS